MKNISQSIDNVESAIKISGEAKYISDFKMDGLLYAKTVRSTESKAKILKVHYPKMPKGYTVVDYRDIPGKNIVKMIFDDWKIFAEETVEHIGEPIALIIGKDKARIAELVKKTRVEYKPLKPVFDYTKSVIEHHFTKGKPEKAFSEADRIIEYSYETGYQEQTYIEPQGFIAYPEGATKVTLVGSIQCPYYVKNAVIDALKAKEADVRVIQAMVGGAFGGKEEFPSVMACQLAVAVKKINRPIKLIYEREEDMEVTTKRHPSKTHLRAAIDKDQRISAIQAQVALDGGAYIGLSGVVLSRALIAVTSAYTIENLDVTGDVFITNTVPNGAFRGFGAPQMIYAIEMFMHHIAKDLNIDPFIFRKQYLAKQGDKTSTSGTFRDPIIMPAMIEKATAISNYHEKVQQYEQTPNFKGIGMSWFLHGCGFTGSGEATHINAKVKLQKEADDTVQILIAAVDMGQGAKTTMRKLVASLLDLPIDRVIFNNPDTDFVPDSGPTVASRTMMIVGGLLARATEKLKKAWVSGEVVSVMEQYQQPDYVKWNENTFTGDAYPAYSWGVNIVEVEVCPITYQVKVVGIWSVYDLGKAIDERVVMGQADGGIAQGVAYGYLEVMQHDKGKLKQKNMTDYIIPTSVDIAPTENHIMDNPYALGPYGAKGVGELTLVGGAPAVALAIEQAIGKKIHRIPATPESILEVLKSE